MANGEINFFWLVKCEVLKNNLKPDDLLSALMLHIQAFAAEREQRSCSSSMYKLAEDFKVGQLNSIFLSLQHEPNFILYPL